MINLKFNNHEFSNIDTVLFDKDGTFIDLHYFWGKMTELRVNEIIKLYGLKEGLFPELCLKLGYDTSCARMLSDGITALYSRPVIIQIFCKDLQDFGVNISENELENIFDSVSTIFYQDMIKYTKPIDSAIDFIKNIKSRGVKTGIVTSDSVESTHLTLKHFNWEPLFNVVIGRESTTETKESGAPVKMALEILGANPQSTIMIGDAPMDYLAAKNAGLDRTILVATGQIKQDELSKTSEYTINTLNDINIF